VAVHIGTGLPINKTKQDNCHGQNLAALHRMTLYTACLIKLVSSCYLTLDILDIKVDSIQAVCLELMPVSSQSACRFCAVLCS